MIKRIFISFFVAVFALFVPLEAMAEKPLIVVELFTSEFCPACPPADQLLEKMAEESHIIALGCHVTYFQRRSDLGRATCTQRQFDYVSSLKSRSPFTPQFVFNGKHSAVGVRNNEVSAALMKASAQDIAKIDITLRARNVFSYSLPSLLGQDTNLWLAIYKDKQAIKKRSYANSVDVMLPLGAWDGRQHDQVFAPALRSDHAGFTIYAQDKKTGAIIAAGEYRTN